MSPAGSSCKHEGMEEPGQTLAEAAAELRVSIQTIRRHIGEYRRRTGQANDGLIHYRGRSIAFRRVPGLKNNEYRLWLDADVVPPAPEVAKDTMTLVLERLDAIEVTLREMDGRLRHLEGKE